MMYSQNVSATNEKRGPFCFHVAMEITGPDYRVWTGGVMHITWAVGYLVLPGIAYFLTNWRHLIIILGCVQFVTFVLFVL